MPNTPFDTATAAIATGDLPTLRHLLAKNPGLCPATPSGVPRSHENDLLLFLTSWPGGRPNGAETARLLLDSGADPNTRFHDRGETALHWAASCATDTSIVDVLVDRGADIDAVGGVIRGGTPLMNALYFGFKDVATHLVTRGASILNLICAAGLGRVDLIEGWNRGSERYRREAIRISSSEVIGEAWLSEGEVQQWTYDAVIAALCCEQYATVDWFIGHGFEINRIPDGAEWSCLHHAAYTGSLPMATYLVAKGANLNAHTAVHPVTAAHYGAAHGHPEVMNYLIDQGTFLTLEDAASLGRLDRVVDQIDDTTDLARLLNRTIGVKTDIGKPVVAELRRARLAIAAHLLQRDANLASQPVNGETARERAETLGDHDFLGLLSRFEGMGR